MGMIGVKVAFSYKNPQGDRIEEKGVIQDKVKLSDVIKDIDGKYIGVCAVDIYLIKKEDGTFISMHPTNLIKEI